MSADVLLSRLTRVRKVGAGRWVACCPSHGSGRNQGLAIRELADGRVLAHCFAGCALQEVLSAIGLNLSDLFPESISSAEATGDRRYRSGTAMPFSPEQCLRAVHADVLTAATIVSQAMDGQIDEQERAALWQAAGRIAGALESINAR